MAPESVFFPSQLLLVAFVTHGSEIPLSSKHVDLSIWFWPFILWGGSWVDSPHSTTSVQFHGHVGCLQFEPRLDNTVVTTLLEPPASCLRFPGESLVTRYVSFFVFKAVVQWITPSEGLSE